MTPLPSKATTKRRQLVVWPPFYWRPILGRVVFILGVLSLTVRPMRCPLVNATVITCILPCVLALLREPMVNMIRRCTMDADWVKIMLIVSRSILLTLGVVLLTLRLRITFLCRIMAIASTLVGWYRSIVMVMARRRPCSD